MRNVIRKVLRAVRMAMAKAGKIGKAVAVGLWNGVADVGAFLRGGQGAAQQLPMLEDEATEIEEFESDLAPENADELSPYERKRQGYEPHDVRAYAAARTAEERAGLGQRLTLKTRAWASALSGEEKHLVATASARALKAHLDGTNPLPGVREIGIIDKLRDPMANPHGNGLASKLINEGRGATFGKRNVMPQAVEASSDAPASFRAKQARNHQRKAKQRAEAPRPPYRMMNQKQAFGA